MFGIIFDLILFALIFTKTRNLSSLAWNPPLTPPPSPSLNMRPEKKFLWSELLAAVQGQEICQHWKQGNIPCLYNRKLRKESINNRKLRKESINDRKLRKESINDRKVRKESINDRKLRKEWIDNRKLRKESINNK